MTFGIEVRARDAAVRAGENCNGLFVWFVVAVGVLSRNQKVRRWRVLSRQCLGLHLHYGVGCLLGTKTERLVVKRCLGNDEPASWQDQGGPRVCYLLGQMNLVSPTKLPHGRLRMVVLHTVSVLELYSRVLLFSGDVGLANQIRHLSRFAFYFFQGMWRKVRDSYRHICIVKAPCVI